MLGYYVWQLTGEINMSLATTFSQTIDDKQVKEIEDLLKVLPHDLLHEIFSHLGLDPKQFTMLSQLSRGWHQFISKLTNNAIKKYFPYLINNTNCHNWGDYQPISFFFKECQYYAKKYKGLPLNAILNALNGDPSKLLETSGAPKSLAYGLMMLNHHKLPEKIDETTLAIAQKPLLVLSASLGRLETVNSLISSKGISKADLGNALGEAAAFNHLEIMATLLNLGLPLSLEEAFCKAAAGGHVTALEKLGNFSAFSESSKNTALINTVRGNHFHALDYLLSKGSFSISTLGAALYIAARRGRAEIAYLLLQKSSDIPHEVKNQAIIEAAKRGSAEIVSMLKQTIDADIEVIYNMMIKLGFYNEANIFLSTTKQAHINSKVNALIFAAMKGHLNVVECFTVDLDIPPRDFIFALKEAVRNGQIDVVKLLADTNSKKLGEIILFEAAVTNQLPIATWALSNYKLSHDNFKNALLLAARIGNAQIASLILKVGVRRLSTRDKFNAILVAVSRDYLDVVLEFDLKPFNQTQQIMLIQNARQSPSMMVYLLDKLKLPVTQIAVNIKGKSISLLAYVAAFGSTETLIALLNNINWDWGNLKQAALDEAIANKQDKNADLIQANMNEQLRIEIAPRTLVTSYNQGLVLTPTENQATPRAAPGKTGNVLRY